MNNQTITDRLLLSKPIFRVIIQLSILIGTGITGILLSWERIPLYPVSNIIGGILIIGSLWFKKYCIKTHKEAHYHSEEISAIITDGIYSKVRHPLYMATILLNFGIALSFGIMWALLPAILFSALVMMIAVKEEKVLSKKFPEEYSNYFKIVPWRMIPGVF